MTLYLGEDLWSKKRELLKENGVTHRVTCVVTEKYTNSWFEYLEQNDNNARTNLFPAMHFGALTSNTDEEETNDVEEVQAPMIDEPSYVRAFAMEVVEKGANFVHEAISKGGTVYVHCNHGVSRSASLVLMYLMIHKRMPLLDACELLKTKRCKVSPNDGFIDLLLEKEKDVFGAASDRAKVLTVVRKKWLQDWKAGKIQLNPVDRIV